MALGFDAVCARELELCGIREDDSVAILTAGSREVHAAAMFAAAESMGALAYEVRVSPRRSAGMDTGTYGTTPLAGNRAAIQSLKEADLVIDLIGLLFSPEQEEILDSGTRMVLAMESIPILTRLFPSKDLRRRVEAGERLMGKAASIRLTNPAGTEVTYDVGTMSILTEYGYSDQPGRWDHWPSGFVATAPDEGGVNGRIVLSPGDIVCEFRRYLQTPVEMRVEEGRIVDISGGIDADLMRDYIEGFSDDDAYAIAHVGWGLNERARWSALLTEPRSQGMEARSFYGNVLISTGPNTEFGGTNASECHLDIPMHGCTLYLDDDPVVVDGAVAVDEMKASGR